MKRKWNLWNIVWGIFVSVSMSILLFADIILFIYLGRGTVFHYSPDHSPDIDDVKGLIKILQEERKKKYTFIKTNAYQKGIQDYQQGVKKERGFDYPAEAEKVMEGLPENVEQPHPNSLYDDFYEKGWRDAQKESQK